MKIAKSSAAGAGAPSKFSQFQNLGCTSVVQHKKMNVQQPPRATANPQIIMNETTNKTQFVDTNRQGSRKGEGEQYLKRAL